MSGTEVLGTTLVLFLAGCSVDAPPPRDLEFQAIGQVEPEIPIAVAAAQRSLLELLNGANKDGIERYLETSVKFTDLRNPDLTEQSLLRPEPAALGYYQLVRPDYRLEIEPMLPAVPLRLVSRRLGSLTVESIHHDSIRAVIRWREYDTDWKASQIIIARGRR